VRARNLKIIRLIVLKIERSKYISRVLRVRIIYKPGNYFRCSIKPLLPYVRNNIRIRLYRWRNSCRQSLNDPSSTFRCERIRAKRVRHGLKRNSNSYGRRKQTFLVVRITPNMTNRWKSNARQTIKWLVPRTPWRVLSVCRRQNLWKTIARMYKRVYSVKYIPYNEYIIFAAWLQRKPNFAKTLIQNLTPKANKHKTRAPYTYTSTMKTNVLILIVCSLPKTTHRG